MPLTDDEAQAAVFPSREILEEPEISGEGDARPSNNGLRSEIAALRRDIHALHTEFETIKTILGMIQQQL